jgi:hypothetical protein
MMKVKTGDNFGKTLKYLWKIHEKHWYSRAPCGSNTDKTLGKHWKNLEKPCNNPWDNLRKTLGKSWKNSEITFENSLKKLDNLKNPGKTMVKSWKKNPVITFGNTLKKSWFFVTENSEIILKKYLVNLGLTKGKPWNHP